uniref:RING-type domain-containing protein n=1 Tax=Panagrellus redivivus TaxID=6233 RepID=A0A7E4VLJ9_PANRE
MSANRSQYTVSRAPAISFDSYSPAITSTRPQHKSQNQQLAEIATCSICNKRYNNDSRAPIGIPCGHTFCRTCVNSNTAEKTVSCSKCHRTSLIGFSGLSKNVVLIQYLEKLNLLAKDDKTPPKPDTNMNPVSEETFKGIKLAGFDRHSQFFMKFVEGYMDFQLDGPSVCTNMELISDVRETLSQVDDAKLKLQIGLEALRNPKSE